MVFDYEDTFSYFKSLVLFYKEAGQKDNYTHTLTKKYMDETCFYGCLWRVGWRNNW